MEILAEDRRGFEPISVVGAPRFASAPRQPAVGWVRRSRALATLNTARGSQVSVLRGATGTGKSVLLHQLYEELLNEPKCFPLIVDSPRVDRSLLEAEFSAASARPSVKRVVILDSYVEEDHGEIGGSLIDRMRDDRDLFVVVATRQHTMFESPMVALEFDTQILPAEALLFDGEECAALLVRHGVTFTVDAAEQLNARLFGWPALVQLAATHLRNERLPLQSTDDVKTVAQMALDVFCEQMSDELDHVARNALQMASVAPYVTAPLFVAAEMVPDIRVAEGVLRAAGRAGLLWTGVQRMKIAEPLRHWWQSKLVDANEIDMAALRAKVAQHLGLAGDALRVAEMHASAGEWEEVASVLARDAPAAWSQDKATFERFVDKLADVGTDSLAGLTVLTQFREDRVPRTGFSERVARVLAAQPATRGRELSSPLPDSAERMYLLRATGRFGLASDIATRILQHHSAGVGLGAIEGKPISGSAQAAALLQAGLSLASTAPARQAAEAIELAYRETSEPARRVDIVGARALVLLTEGYFYEAEALIEDAARPENERWIDSPWGVSTLLARAAIAVNRGEPSEALDDLRRAQNAGTLRDWWPLAASLAADAYLMLGSPTSALATLRDYDSRYQTVPGSHPMLSLLVAARARVNIALRQARRASSLFRAPFGPSDHTVGTIGLTMLCTGREHEAFILSLRWLGRPRVSPAGAIQSLVVNAIAALRLGDQAAARSAVEKAESISEQYGCWGYWSVMASDERTQIQSMLSEAARATIATVPQTFDFSVRVPVLTRRELVVLRRLRPTSTIAELARELVVSPNTLKTQLQSLYRKLGVSDRASAIRAAHAWGLIEEDSAPAARAS